MGRIGFIQEEETVKREERRIVKPEETVLSEHLAIDLNTRKSGRNNNVMILGSSGAGKTRYILKPNLLQANTNYVVIDPKGTLYREMAPYLKTRGYETYQLDLKHPEQSKNHYNPFASFRSEADVLRFAHQLIQSTVHMEKDMFWEQCGEMLLSSIMLYLYETCKDKTDGMRYVDSLLSAFDCTRGEQQEIKANPLARIFEEQTEKYERSAYVSPAGFTKETSEFYKMWQRIRYLSASGKTGTSVWITAQAAYKNLSAPGMFRLMQKDDGLIREMIKPKTACFISISDTDPTKNFLASAFMEQMLNYLCDEADVRENGALPVHIRFIMDDFCSIGRICNMEQIIATMRSRNLSAMLVAQNKAQLQSIYGRMADNLMGNCDSLIYLGSNDISSNMEMAQRMQCSMGRIMQMKTGECIVISKGTARFDKLYPLEEHPNYHALLESEKPVRKPYRPIHIEAEPEAWAC